MMRTWKQSAGRRRKGGRMLCGRCVVCAWLAMTCVRFAASAQAGSDPTRLWVEGQAAFNDRQYKIARERLDTYLRKGDQLTPENRERALILLARSLHALERYRDAMDVLKPRGDWMGKLPDSAALVFLRGLTRFRMEQYKEAIQTVAGFETAFDAPDDAAKVLRLRAWCHLKLEQVDEALAAFEAFDATYGATPEGGDNLLEWSKTLIARDRHDAARPILLRLSRRSPETVSVVEGKILLGRLLFEANQLAAALSVAVEAGNSETARATQRAEAWLLAGEVSRASGNIEEAVEAYRKGLEYARDPGMKRSIERAFGFALIAAGDVDAGIERVKAVILADPESPDARAAQLRLADTLLESGRAEPAVAAYQHYLETFNDRPGTARAQEGKGWALTALGRHAEASVAFEKAYALYEDPARRETALFKMADAVFANGQYRLAAEHYEKLLSAFPDSAYAPRAEFRRAESLLRGGAAEAGEAALLQFAEKRPEHELTRRALLRVAEQRQDRDDAEGAVAMYERVMDAYPDDPVFAEALHGRGYVRYRQWRFRDALADFQRVIAVRPDALVAVHARYQSAMCQYWLGRDQEALARCREFVADYPESAWAPDAMFWIAKYDYNNADYASAEKRFLDFVARYPEHALADDALLQAGKAAVGQKEYVRAIELFTRMAKDYPQSSRMAEARFAQGNALCEQARFSAAILIFEEIINNHPESDLVAAAWGRKGDCQFTLGAEDSKRYEESMASYRVVAGSSSATPDLILQAEYKIGRSLEKLDRTTEAFEQYYTAVILRYFHDREQGIWHNQASKFWFARAARHAADIMEARKEWRRAVAILERLQQAGVSPAEEQQARERVARIKSEHWWLFY